MSSLIYNPRLHKKEIMTVFMPDRYTLDIGGSYVVLPLEQTNDESKVLINIDNGIKIGKGISKVLVSAQCCYNSLSNNGVKWATIYKNGSARIPTNLNMTTRGSLPISPVTMEVTEGDIIDLRVNGTVGDTIREGYYTYLTVEKIK